MITTNTNTICIVGTGTRFFHFSILQCVEILIDILVQYMTCFPCTLNLSRNERALESINRSKQQIIESSLSSIVSSEIVFVGRVNTYIKCLVFRCWVCGKTIVSMLLCLSVCNASSLICDTWASQIRRACWSGVVLFSLTYGTISY